ncbi:MAG: hypothetical protein ABSB66_08410 [Candidatus Acidiferrales bacterium]
MPRAKLKTKKLAQRIDLNYFKRPHPFRRLRFILSVCVPALAIIWLAWYGLTRNNHVYSSGKMSVSHAVLTEQCDSCHLKEAGVFSAKASDQACETCHDGPIHHTNQLFTPNCATCHREHRGSLRLAATSDASCTQCHANLRANGSAVRYARNIDAFDSSHPEFAAVRAGNVDPGTIKLNHQVHLKKNLMGPNGVAVQLDCGDCHRPPASNEPWRFGVQQPKASSVVQKEEPPSINPARAYMSPVTYAQHCIACHGLQFDKRFAESVPHDTPTAIHAFVVLRFRQYIATHPAELRITNSDPNLPQKPFPVSPRVLSSEQWVTERTAESEQLLWRKTCMQCHALSFPTNQTLPVVAKSNITVRWFQHAVFNHDEHRLVKCEECHSAARKSQETADVLLPGIRTCEQCHHSGSEAAEARCFECHTYHDWSKEKPAQGSLTLFELKRSSLREASPPGAQPSGQ